MSSSTPGTLVDVKAYSPIARRMAESGYHTALATPPLSLSFADVDLADEVVHYRGWKDTVNVWSISGHSQGGAIACAYANDNRSSSLKGVILLASFPGSGGLFNGDLSDSEFTVTSIYGNRDGLVSEEEIENSKKALPSNTKFVEIDGGNHSQFSYVAKLQKTGDKKADLKAEISLEEQQEIICTSMLDLLGDITP